MGLNIPKRMGCREFAPGIDNFCSNPNDFVSADQIVQMASFFGIKGMELKKVKVMAARAEETRSNHSSRPGRSYYYWRIVVLPKSISRELSFALRLMKVRMLQHVPEEKFSTYVPGFVVGDRARRIA